MNIIWQETIFSDSSSNFISNPTPALDEKVTFSFRINKNRELEKAFFVANPKGEIYYYKMSKTKEDNFFSYYSVEYKIEVKELIYKFFIVVDGKGYYYDKFGLSMQDRGDFFAFKIITDNDYSSWSPEAIFYQIFPDRFNRVGNNELDDRKVIFILQDKRVIEGKRVLSNWDDPIIKNTRISDGEFTIQYYGGNFNGIKEKVDYLKELGITAIYFNPINKGRSNHRFDVEDYLTPDPLLGTEKELESMIKTLHDNGIKVIFDGVLNHTGVFHKWFDHLGETEPKGAFASKTSQYIDYYYFNEHPYKYESWFNYGTLPQLNLANKQLIGRLLTDKDSAIKKWLKKPFAIDGWRLDTASILGKFPLNKVNEEFNKTIHKSIKDENKDAYIVGETFYDPKELVDYNKYEATMNYRGFMLPLVKWLTKITNLLTIPREDGHLKLKFSAKEMSKQLDDIRNSLDFQNQIRMYNLLDSHDVVRFWTQINKNFNKLKVALSILFTYIGIPAIYYGDEVGIEGEGDPDCRRPMIWDEKKQNKKIFKLYKDLITFRKSNKVLVYGSYINIFVSKKMFAYARFMDNKIIITAVSNSKKIKCMSMLLTPLGIKNGTFVNIYDGKEYKVDNYVLKIELKKCDAMILVL